jgi:HipA-like protein
MDRLILWCDGGIVAEVSRTAPDFTSLRLAYAPEWVARPGAFPVSARFPLGARAYGGPEIYFWFLNLLPEGESLALIGHLLHVSDIDVLGLMDRMGGDLPGALVARRPGWLSKHSHPEARVEAASRQRRERGILHAARRGVRPAGGRRRPRGFGWNEY